MQPSPCCFESKNRGAEGDKRVQGGSADSWSFGISDRNIASTSGTCNHLTLGSWPGKFRAAPTALCSQWLWMIPSSGELTIKLNNSCPYCWLRHFLGKKKIILCSEEVSPAWKLTFLGRIHRGGKKRLKTPLWVLSWRYTGFFLADLKTAKRDQPEITPQE